MRCSIQRRFFPIWMVIVTSILLFSNSSFAASYIKFCSSWTRTYTDAGYGEDYYTSRATNVQSGAIRARYEVREGSVTSAPVDVGFLDGVGCMSTAIEIQPGTDYYFTQGTWANRDGRRVWVNTTAGSSLNNSINWLTSKITTGSSLINNYTYSHTFNTVWPDPSANVMPIVGHVLNTYYLYAMPEYSLIRIRTDIGGECDDDGAYYMFDPTYGPGGRICIISDDDEYSWGDMTTWKFALAHEFGHFIADHTGGPYPANYSDNPVESLCRCDYIAGYGSTDTHCLQSREHAAAAQGEAFADFIATAAMNARSVNNGWYVYAKPEIVLYADWDVIGPPSPTRTFRTSSEVYSDRWMEKYCNPGDVAKGVQLDWLRFYYETWTSGTYKYSVQEILDVWDDASDLGWNNTSGSIKQTVESQWGVGTSKTNLFTNKADQAGVNHG